MRSAGRTARGSAHASSRVASSLLAAAALVYLVSVVPGVRPDGPGYVPALDRWYTQAVMLAAAACCAVRAHRHRPERRAWGLVAASVLVYLLGDTYYYVALVDLPTEEMPYPSLADAAWLGWYPLLASGLLHLVRARLRAVPAVLWLDGLTAGAGAAAVAGAAFLQPLLASDGGDLLLVLVNLAYPVADLVLLTVVTVVFHLNGWRPDATWRWIGLATAVLMLGDCVYMLQVAADTYVDGGLLDATWPVAFACLGMAALARPGAVGEMRPDRVAVAIPATFSLAGTAVLFMGASHSTPLPLVVCFLGILSVLLASARLLLTVRETQRLADARREARTDELTGLPNRRELMDRLARTLHEAQRRPTTSAVLLIDLDRFKEVNDTLGHHHGDQLLRAVAVRLAGIFREYDTVARLGGDEFAVLLPDVADQASAEGLARRCIDALEDAFTIEGLTLHVEASVGLALAPVHGRDGNDLMRAADVAMYEAKSGGHGVVVYDPDLDAHTPTRLALLGDLRRAIQSDELVLHYQPKVDVATGRVGGMEALLRWHHPVRGRVSPDDFVPTAEGSSLMMPLTLHTLRMALVEARRWRDAGHPLQVAVNLSARCLLELGFPGQVQELLHEHGVPAALLRLELTESTIMVDPARALTILTALDALGVSLSIDDFGTGYSSMSYLKRLPVDELKIDRSFVQDMLASDDGAVLVRSSIELGHNLGMSVVAEGVEDAETLAALAALDCDVVQGYHLARPMPADAVVGWLRDRGAGSGVVAAARGDARPAGVPEVAAAHR